MSTSNHTDYNRAKSYRASLEFKLADMSERSIPVTVHGDFIIYYAYKFSNADKIKQEHDIYSHACIHAYIEDLADIYDDYCTYLITDESLATLHDDMRAIYTSIKEYIALRKALQVLATYCNYEVEESYESDKA